MCVFVKKCLKIMNDNYIHHHVFLLIKNTIHGSLQYTESEITNKTRIVLLHGRIL
jgi:hypothetical protein